MPRGEHGGGRFTNEHGSGRSRIPSFVAPFSAAATRTAAAEAGVVAGATGAAAMAGVLGGAMLGLTSDSRAGGPTPPDAGGGRTTADDAPISLKARQACEADDDDEVTQCYNAFGLKRRPWVAL